MRESAGEEGVRVREERSAQGRSVGGERGCVPGPQAQAGRERAEGVQCGPGGRPAHGEAVSAFRRGGAGGAGGAGGGACAQGEERKRVPGGVPRGAPGRERQARASPRGGPGRAGAERSGAGAGKVEARKRR